MRRANPVRCAWGQSTGLELIVFFSRVPRPMHPNMDLTILQSIGKSPSPFISVKSLWSKSCATRHSKPSTSGTQLPTRRLTNPGHLPTSLEGQH